MRYAWSRTTGRRGTAIASSAAALCLGAVLSGCAGGDDGYLAAEAAGPNGPSATSAPPGGGVKLVPLDGDGQGDRKDSGRGGKGRSSGSGDTKTSGAPDASSGRDGTAATRTPGQSPGETPGRTGADDGGRTGGTHDGTGGSGGGSGSGGSGPADGSGGSGSTDGPQSTPGSPSTPSGPAVLKIGDLVRAAADDRWCEKVTVEFRNTGGTPVTSGTITFATHIIDALGIDWATIESKRNLPVPILAGGKKEKTWEVCVDDWRVPLGMHIETQDASVTWPKNQAGDQSGDQSED
ncbi:hypothetical protein [Streptomyces milbemycinicus]|uniref:hypothetical protein n=1 Tax=Streptomyces milbemycinicus TaxID=476552 RepID=UPI0033FDF2F5